MKMLLAGLLLAPLALSAQAKPEVANATKAAKRAWESAPAEKKASWIAQRDALINVDLSDETQRQIIIARGSPKPEEYHAHPTTAMLAGSSAAMSGADERRRRARRLLMRGSA